MIFSFSGLARWVLLLSFAVTTFAQANDWKEIVIATDATYPPFESLAPNGELVGFEIDLAKAICERAQLKCKIVNVAWDGLIPGLIAKKFDAIMSSMNVTEERKRVVDFTDPYHRISNRFVAKKGFSLPLTKAGLKGKVIAVQKGTVQDFFATEQFGDSATIKRYNGAGEPYLELLSGRADLHFGAVEQIVVGFLQKGDNGKRFELIGPVFTGDQHKKLGSGTAIALRKSDTGLRDLLNSGIKTVQTNGLRKQLYEKHFGPSAPDHR